VRRCRSRGGSRRPTFDSLTSGLDPASDPALDPALDLASAPASASSPGPEPLDDDITSTRIPVPPAGRPPVSGRAPSVIPVATTKKSSPPPAVIPRMPAPPPGSGPDETDFSDLGFDGPPEALGSLLGQPPELPPLHEVADIEAYTPTGFEEDAVFTSAARPGSVMPGPDSPRPGDEDPIAILPGDELGGDAGFGHTEATRVAEVPRELLDADETMDRPASRSPGHGGAALGK
jgi:hypothetical protein